MFKRRNPSQLTKAETIERTRDAKSYLGNKERIAIRRTGQIYLPSDYNPDSDESYYAAPRLSNSQLDQISQQTVSLVTTDWSDLKTTKFIRTAVVDFVRLSFQTGAAIGETVEIVFYPWKDRDTASKLVATKFATLWLGTWHHAPMVAWTAGILMVGEINVKVNFLPKYSDLIK